MILVTVWSHDVFNYWSDWTHQPTFLHAHAATYCHFSNSDTVTVQESLSDRRHWLKSRFIWRNNANIFKIQLKVKADNMKLAVFSIQKAMPLTWPLTLIHQRVRVIDRCSMLRQTPAKTQQERRRGWDDWRWWLWRPEKYDPNDPNLKKELEFILLKA